MDLTKQILSLQDLTSSDNVVYQLTNVKLYYFSRLSKLIPWYDTFHYYFYVIKNNIYISDLEFKNVYSYFTLNEYQQNIEANGVSKGITINIDNGFFIKNIYSNAGHSFGNITHHIYTIFNNNVDINNCFIIITADLLEYNKFLVSIIFLFFKKEKIIVLQEKMTIKCTQLYCVKDKSHKHPANNAFLLDKLKKNINNQQCAHDNIFLIKSVNTQNVTDGCFKLEYNEYFISKGFKLIIPENHDIIELFNIIYNAKNVILSWGCCAYLNSVFVNEHANVFVISHIRYNNEYNEVIKHYNGGIYNSGWFPEKCNKKIFLGDLESTLDEQTIELLDQHMSLLIDSER